MVNLKNLKNQSVIKANNMAMILNMIRDSEGISKAEIARIAKLSGTTVSNLVNEMADYRLVEELGVGESESKLGRKPTMLAICNDKYFSIAVIIDSDHITIGIYNLTNQAVFTKSYDYEYDSTMDKKIAKQIMLYIESALEKTGVAKEFIVGITIGVSGIIDPIRRTLVSSTVYPFKDIDFISELKNTYNTPIYIENVSDLAAVAEKDAVKSRSVRDLVCLEVHDGICAGIIINDEIYYGKFGGAGEVGHVSINFDGPLCKCGNRGCLEVYANKEAILKKVAELSAQSKDHYLEAAMREKNKRPLSVIAKAAENGDVYCKKIIRDEAKYLTLSVQNIINTFNPEVIVIGGEVTDLGESLLQSIKQYLRETLFEGYVDKINIVLSKLGENAKLDGAAILASRRFFYAPHLKFDL